MSTHATGAYVSPFDYRDKIAAAAALGGEAPLVLPPTFHTDLGKKLDQKLIPACVAHDVVYLLRRYWFRQTGQWIDFSPRFLDILVKRIDGQDRLTGGTYPRYVLKLAATVGCCTTATLPNDTTLPILKYRDDAAITDAMLKEAEQYKIPGFINVPLDFVSTRQAVYLYEALSGLFVIGNEFWTPSWQPKDIDPVQTPANPVSGHQLAIVGWDSPTLNLGCNEWGENWNLKGEFHYDPTAWKQFIYEQWAVAEIPTDVKSFLKVLPSPANFHYNWLHDMHRGDFSTDVQQLQVAYMILGYLTSVAPEDFGRFGPRTAAANYAFQTSNHISPVADSAGPLTRAALNKKFAL